jgi:hypothetical protein
VTDELVDRVIRRQGWLDPLAAVVQRAVGKGYAILGAPGAALRSAMHGTRIAGHALHPALTDLPAGAWIAGVVFDFVAHFTSRIPTEAGDIALAIGLVGALGAAPRHRQPADERSLPRELRFLGIQSGPVLVRAPEGNGCSERVVCT